MSDSLFEKIKAGLIEAIEYEKGNTKVTVHKITISPLHEYTAEKIKGIRQKFNLTQKLFAYVMGVSIKTIEAWESGRNAPSGAALRMLEILDQDEKALEKYHILQHV
jgi:putative transcriptional regulator